MVKKGLIIIAFIVALLFYFNIISLPNENGDYYEAIQSYLNNLSKGVGSFDSFLKYCGMYINDITNNFGSSFGATIKSILSVMYAPVGFSLGCICTIADVILSILGFTAHGYTAEFLYSTLSLDGFIRSIGSSIYFIGRFKLF